MEGPDGQLLLSIPMDALQRDKLPKYYCFAKGRHSGSFFLKVLLTSDLREKNRIKNHLFADWRSSLLPYALGALAPELQQADHVRVRGPRGVLHCRQDLHELSHPGLLLPPVVYRLQVL